MTHFRMSGARLAGRVHGLYPVDALERHRRIFFAAKLDGGSPVSRCREKQLSGIRSYFFLFLEAVTGVRPVRARRENPTFARFDRLAGLLVLHHDSVRDRLERARRQWVRSDPKCVVVRPKPQVESARTRAA